MLDNTIVKNNQKIFNEKYVTVIRNPIASGSFGCVYLVKDIQTNKK